MADFTSAIRAPATGLFAFGIMLPLALVSLVPTVPMVGYSANIWLFVLLYNIVLPGTLIAASLWLLVRRPVAFPPPRSTTGIRTSPIGSDCGCYGESSLAFVGT